MLEENGVEAPEHFSRGRGPMGFLMDLTEEQKEAIHEKITELREEGASHEEIHAAVGEMLEEYGVELPENWGERRGRKEFFGNLTEEQREAIHKKMREMRDEGATHEEIHATVSEMLKEYGVEVPERLGERPHRMGFFAELTEDQREAVREKMKEMRDEGATHEEIHATVSEMFEEYGIELPEHWGERRRPMGFLAELTEEQRQAIREKMKRMRSEGATREEIHATVSEMLEKYGIELAEHPESSSEASLSSEGVPTSPKSLQESYANPNPFNEQTTIFYTLSARNDVHLKIYNATGQLVKSFEMGVQEPGDYSVKWDGTYEDGTIVPGGVYLYRIEIDGEPVTGRLVVLR
jgi:uncharacterized membrane-anchored protein